MRKPLVDQRFMTAIRLFWPSNCNIERVLTTKDDANQDVESGVETVEGCDNIPCRLGPLSETAPADKEVRTPSITSFVRRRDLKLNGLFPQITQGMRAVVDGVSYPIVGVDSDSQMIYTRLSLEVIKA